MNRENRFYVLGAGYISSMGQGTLGSFPGFSCKSSDFDYPDLKLYITELPSRFGRFDEYTKLSFSAATLALHNAGLSERQEDKLPYGVVVGSRTETFDNDLKYYESTVDGKGEYSSPNLFSYTLPNVALGEIAVYYKYTGPVFCVGNDPAAPGDDALDTAKMMLSSGQCRTILTGWVEVSEKIENTELIPKGAAFLVLSLDTKDDKGKGLLLNEKHRFLDLFKG